MRSISGLRFLLNGGAVAFKPSNVSSTINFTKHLSTMPKYKLTYLSKQGKGEPIRLLLAYGGEEFEDFRVDREDLHTVKHLLPLGQVPILEIDGKVLNQSLAICRYLARIYSLYGENAWEAAQIDIIVDTIYEFRIKMVTMHHQNNPILKEKKYTELIDSVVPLYLDRLEALAKENGGYLANGKLSLADIFFYGCYDALSAFIRFDIAEKYPNLGTVRDNCSKIPNIRKYVENRPKTAPLEKSP